MNARAANWAHAMAEILSVADRASGYVAAVLHHPSRTVLIHLAGQGLATPAVRTQPHPINDLRHLGAGALGLDRLFGR